MSKIILFPVVSDCFKVSPICSYMFKGCSGCSYMFQGFSYMFPVVSKLFQRYFKVSPICSYMFFLIKLFLVVSGSLNCFWLFLYISYMFIFVYSVFRHFWAFLGGFMTSMVFLYLSIYLKGLKGI